MTRGYVNDKDEFVETPLNGRYVPQPTADRSLASIAASLKSLDLSIKGFLRDWRLAEERKRQETWALGNATELPTEPVQSGIRVPNDGSEADGNAS